MTDFKKLYEFEYLDAKIAIWHSSWTSYGWCFATSVDNSLQPSCPSEFIAVRLAIAEVEDFVRQHYGSIEEYYISRYNIEDEAVSTAQEVTADAAVNSSPGDDFADDDSIPIPF